MFLAERLTTWSSEDPATHSCARESVSCPHSSLQGCEWLEFGGATSPSVLACPPLVAEPRPLLTYACSLTLLPRANKNNAFVDHSSTGCRRHDAYFLTNPTAIWMERWRNWRVCFTGISFFIYLCCCKCYRRPRFPLQVPLHPTPPQELLKQC